MGKGERGRWSLRAQLLSFNFLFKKKKKKKEKGEREGKIKRRREKKKGGEAVGAPIIYHFCLSSLGRGGRRRKRGGKKPKGKERGKTN